jgi:hypothetical protein
MVRKTDDALKLQQKDPANVRCKNVLLAMDILYLAGVRPDTEFLIMCEKYIKGELTADELVAAILYKAREERKGRKITLATALQAVKAEWSEWGWEGPNAIAMRQVVTAARIEGIDFSKEELALLEKVVQGEMTTDQLRALVLTSVVH